MRLKIIVIITVIAAALGAAWYHLGRGPLPGSSAVRTAAPIPTNEIPALFASLPADTMLALRIRPAQVAPLVEFLEGVKSRFLQLKIARKFDLERALADSLPILSGAAPSGAPRPEELLQGFGAVMRYWNRLDSIAAVVLSRTAKGPAGIEVPLAATVLTFKDPADIAEIRAMLEREVLKNGAAGEMNGVSIAAAPGTPGRYTVAIAGAATPEPFAAIDLRDTQAAVMTGALDPSAILNGGAAGTLPAGPDSALAYAFHPDAAVDYVVNVAQIEGALERFEHLLVGGAVSALATPAPGAEDPSAEARAVMQSFKKMISGLQITAGSLSVTHGFRGTQCLTVAPDSRYHTLYAAYLDGIQSVHGKGRFESLLSAQTVWAVRLLSAGYDKIVAATLENYLHLDPAGDDIPSIRDFVARIEDFFISFGFREIGIFVNAPAGGPIPEFGLFLGTGNLAGPEALNGLKARYERLLETVKIPLTDANRPVVAPGSAFPHLLTVRLGDPPSFSVVAAEVAPNSIAFGLTEASLTGMKGRLEKETGIFAGAKARSGRNPAADIQSAYWYTYINTEPLLHFLRGWVPIFLGSQSPDASPKIEYGDVDELFTFLSGAVLSTQDFSRVENRPIYCFNGALYSISF